MNLLDNYKNKYLDFLIYIQHKNISKSFKYKCAFWDFHLDNDFGAWNTIGCVLTINNSIYNCSCNHTTNFAILIVILCKSVDFFKLKENKFKDFTDNNQILIPLKCNWCDNALFLVSIIGSGMSILFLLFAIKEFIQIEK